PRHDAEAPGGADGTLAVGDHVEAVVAVTPCEHLRSAGQLERVDLAADHVGGDAVGRPARPTRAGGGAAVVSHVHDSPAPGRPVSARFVPPDALNWPSPLRWRDLRA